MQQMEGAEWKLEQEVAVSKIENMLTQNDYQLQCKKKCVKVIYKIPVPLYPR